MINMTICNVLSTLTIDENTAVVVDSSRELFKNGIGVLDENGKPFEVLSVGMDNILSTDNMSGKVSLLLAGNFSSQRLFV